MSEAFFEWPTAQSIIAWILMQNGREHECSKETACHLIRQPGSESLPITSGALAISGEVVIGLRDPGFKRYPAKGKRISLILHK